MDVYQPINPASCPRSLTACGTAILAQCAVKPLRSLVYYVPRAPAEVREVLKHTTDRKAVARHQADLLRDLLGNPFRPVSADPAWLTWNGGTVRQLAEVIYEERRFVDLPILADALEEAGCTDEDILSHCRGPGEHVRGCWVLDLLLGKE
jgi:hypothetical protein